jgi:carboxylesterase
MSELPGCEPWSKQGGPHGALVLHGFTGCPQSVRPLAEAFAAEGFGVELPRLPGHGTTVEAMQRTGWEDWSAGADEAYQALAQRCDRVVVAGLSMGGALTAWLATRHPEIAGIVCVNPVMRIADSVTDLARQMLESGEETFAKIGGDIADPDVVEVSYEATPWQGIISLAEGVAALRPELGRIRCPVLIMTSAQDHTVPPADSDDLAAAVSGPIERIGLERSYHVATIDYDRGLVCSEATAFAHRVTSS